MTNKTAGNRYARALFDVALAEKVDLQQIETELAAFVDLLRQHPSLEKVLLNPAVPAPRKRDAVGRLLESAKPSPVLGKLLLLLAARDRLVVLPDLLAGYRSRMLDQQNVVRAEVTTASQLEPARAEAIARSLAIATGRTVALTTRVDPLIVGGLVARVGSTVFDASVTRQLEKIRKRLEAGG